VGLLLGVVSLGMPGTLAGNGLFLVGGAILGSGLGGVQVADRVFMIRLSPRAQLGEFFGLYGLVGKGSQVIGQTIYGVIVFVFFDSLGNGAYQLAVLSLIGTMLIGVWLIWPVSDRWRGRAAERAARDDFAVEDLAETLPKPA
jgi:UMF1 family MFS transporter